MSQYLTNEEIKHFENYLNQSGETIQGLADLLDVHVNTAMRIFKGTSISIKTIKTILDKKDVSCKTLLGKDVPYFTESLDNLGEQLKIVRANLNMSHEEIGETLYVANSSFERWEQGRGKPGRFLLDNVAELGGIETKRLLNLPIIEEVDTQAIVRNVRKGLDLTSSRFAELLGMSTKATIEAWEQGDYKPSYQSLAKIADVIHITLYDLVEKTPDELGEIAGKTTVDYTFKMGVTELVHYLTTELEKAEKELQYHNEDDKHQAWLAGQVHVLEMIRRLRA